MLEKVKYKDIWQFTRHYWGRQRFYAAVVFAGMAVVSIIDVILPAVTGKLVDATIQAVKTPEQVWALVLPLLVLYIALDLTFHTIRAGSIHVWNLFAVRNLYSIVRDAFFKVQRFSADWHASSFAGATVRKITRGMWAFDQYEDIIFINLFPSIIVFISVVTMMTWRWPLMGGVILVLSVIFLAVNIYMVAKINAPRFEKSAKRDTRVGASLADAITANNTVKAFGAESREDRRFERVMRGWRYRALDSWLTANATDLVRRVMTTAMMGIMIATVLYLLKQGRATAGDVIYVMNSFFLLSFYLRTLGDQVVNLQKAISEMEDVVSFWLRDDELSDKPQAEMLDVGHGEIVFENVRFGYKGTDKPLFDDLSVTIKPGEKIALVGHSGSGKSTFVKMVQRLHDVDAGEVRIDGQNIADVTQESLRRNIALVPQEPILFHRSLSTNIAYGKPGAKMEEIIEAAKQAYAHDFIESLPQGYDTLVGERGVKLSGGERQRVAIARAILADTRILILDEATSSLDSVSEHYIQKALDHLMEGRTTITVAHRLSTIRNADRILVFEGGRIVEQGTHDELVQRERSSYRELYEMQAMGLEVAV